MVPKFNLSLFLGGCKYPGFEAWHSHVWHGCGNMLMRQWIFRREMKSTKLAKTLMEISGWNPFVDISIVWIILKDQKMDMIQSYPVTLVLNLRLESRNPSLEIRHDVRHNFAIGLILKVGYDFSPQIQWWKTSFSMKKNRYFWWKNWRGDFRPILYFQTQPDIKLVIVISPWKSHYYPHIVVHTIPVES